MTLMADDLQKRWKERYEQAKLREDVDFDTLSSVEVDPVYAPEEVDPKVGYPGEFPFTRGIYPTGYRGRLWTMRQFAGFGTADETNERFHFLIDHGQTGLSVAFDMPTLMGRDSDDPHSLGEVGRCGVAVDSLDDMETLFDGISLEDITTSMTISGPAPMLFAMYIAAAEKQGADVSKLGGTCQTDILKEYIAQKEWLFPPEPHLRLTADMMSFCIDNVPRYYPLSISGYHIREAGSTAAQELAFTVASGFAHAELGIRRGLDIDKVAPGLSFFFNSHIDFFEEIAKFRAARRIWARWMKDRYGAKNERSWMLKFHTQTAGCSLTAQQPYNNVVRTATEALAAVLGGTQSLHTNSLDEVLALPSDEAVEIALRTQQVIGYETGVTNVIDPLGGSWFVEELTDKIEEEAEAYFAKIDDMGNGSILDGMLAGIEEGILPEGDRRRSVPLPAAPGTEQEGHRRRQPVHEVGAGEPRRAPHRGGDRGAAEQSGRLRPGQPRCEEGRGCDQGLEGDGSRRVAELRPGDGRSGEGLRDLGRDGRGPQGRVGRLHRAPDVLISPLNMVRM
jgi:methylmalonyl-CoA mutase, N-terminal domain